MKFLQKYADNTKAHSIVNKWRKKRFKVFHSFISDLPAPLKILDVGGTENFWTQMGYTELRQAEITLFNIDEIKTTYNNFKYIRGDARDLSIFKDNEFDIVFSNSVIEHVGVFEDQKKMADEVMRVGKSHFVQTPNYYFPIEPHFLFPLFQFLPHKIKIFLVRHFNLGWFKKCNSPKDAETLINSINLLKRKEILLLFPNSILKKERLLFLTKSFMIMNKIPLSS